MFILYVCRLLKIVNEFFTAIHDTDIQYIYNKNTSLKRKIINNGK